MFCAVMAKTGEAQDAGHEQWNILQSPSISTAKIDYLANVASLKYGDQATRTLLEPDRKQSVSESTWLSLSTTHRLCPSPVLSGRSETQRH
jgi:hypothetical protein